MKRLYSRLFLIGTAGLVFSSCGDDEKLPPADPGTPGKTQIELVNNGFEDGMEGWTRVNFYNGANTTVEIVEGRGVNNSKCLKIQQFPEYDKCGVGVKQKLTGLEPGELYRMYAKVQYSDIPSNLGRGAVIFDMSTDQYWNSSKFLYGTQLSIWTSVYVDFLAQKDGTAEIVCSLGYRYGGTSSGGFTIGTVFYDNISVVKVSDEMYMKEGEHVQLFIEPDQVSANDQKMTAWVANLDKMYESYKDLVGGVPVEGRKIGILTTKGMESGYWALAGHPILWSSNGNGVSGSLEDTANRDSWNFGIMHEIGHGFNIGNSGWDWNDELFANFRMQYGLEQNNGKVYMNDRIYTGREINDYYKLAYDNSVGSPDGVGGDGIHYMLSRLTDQNVIGWSPFRKAFRELNTTTGSPWGNTSYSKFRHLLSVLSKYATQEAGTDVNVETEYFTPAELASIQKALQ